MTPAMLDLDVRAILRDGGEPFEQIMATINALQPGQGLRLFATFRPTPLLHVLGSKGFTHEAKEIEGGDWEVVFRPAEAAAGEAGHVVETRDDTAWPEPARYLDNRDLDPPEPMTRTLAAIETMPPGQVLSVLLCREPMFLLPELAKRGHSWRGSVEPNEQGYRLLVRIGDKVGAAA